jgi:hypothetical protein
MRRCCPEGPLGNLPVEGANVVTNLYRIRAAVLNAEIPAVRGIEAQRGNGELQEITRLQHAIAFGEHTTGFRDIHKALKPTGEIKDGLGK